MCEEQVRCATWNVHRALGTDGRVDAARVVDAISSIFGPLGLDILALQEADEECPPHGRILDVQEIVKRTGLIYAHDDAHLRWGSESSGFLGTVLFLAPSLERVHAEVIDLPGHCHRGAVSVEVARGGSRFRVLSMHLSLFQPLRAVQMRVVGQYLFRRPPMQTIMLGDLNEWRPWGGLMFHEWLVGTRFRGPLRRTFPSHRPILPLDRIMTDGNGSVRSMRAIQDAEVTLASDHLPLEAIVTVP